jgi:Prenyltransferase and squalene oxidase repeat
VTDPVEPLLEARHPALTWNVRHDLLGKPLDPRDLWELPRVRQAARAQNADGSWTYHGGRAAVRDREDYGQLATYQQLLVLVSQYRLDRRHPVVERAAEYVLGLQRPEGDIRGIYGSQFTPNYTADLLRLLIEAGYADDARVVAGMRWLLSMRQDDGGWAVPARTVTGLPLTRTLRLPSPVAPDRSRPSSHLITGIVLRAFAAHPSLRRRTEAREAAAILAGRFFKPDAYPDRRSAAYWSKLAFPFRWTDIVSALDTVALIGLEATQPDVARGLRWVREHQLPNGLWPCGYPNSPDPLAGHWVTFAAARVLRRFAALVPGDRIAPRVEVARVR